MRQFMGEDFLLTTETAQKIFEKGAKNFIEAVKKLNKDIMNFQLMECHIMQYIWGQKLLVDLSLS